MSSREREDQRGDIRRQLGEREERREDRDDRREERRQDREDMREERRQDREDRREDRRQDREDRREERMQIMIAALTRSHQQQLPHVTITQTR